MTTSESIALKEQLIVGKFINLRIASEADAEYILELRLNPNLNRFIGETNPSVVVQQQWIKNSYLNTCDFHFIIEGKNGIPHGTIAVYNINFEKGIAEWGRWIIEPGSSIFVSIESAVLLMNFAFLKLKLKSLHGGANNLNWQVIKFHKSYANVVAEDQTHTWFTFEEANLSTLRRKYNRILK